MEQLNNQGYVVIQNDNYDKEIFEKKMNNFYKDNNNVDYKDLRNFIDRTYFPVLMNKININEDIFYGKFRFSNNNNSNDASTFHGDCYNHTNDEIIRQYTCLYYFDDAEFELIPETHKKSKYKTKTFDEVYHHKKRVNIQAGTFIIIHANLHHRGVNFTKPTNRRLLQVFDVHFNKKDYDLYTPKFVIIKTEESIIFKMISNCLYNLYKYNNNSSIETLNYLHYFLVFNNIQYKLFINSPSKKDIGKIISYEPGKQCLFEDSEKLKETNINISCDKNIKYESPNLFFFNCYLIYWIVSLILIYLGAKHKDKIKKTILMFLKKNNFIKKNLKNSRKIKK